MLRLLYLFLSPPLAITSNSYTSYDQVYPLIRSTLSLQNKWKKVCHHLIRQNALHTVDPIIAHVCSKRYQLHLYLRPHSA